ncbi:MAG: hypothetical protein WCJ94_01720 [bacterium]
MLIIYLDKKANSGESPVISADTNQMVCDDLISSLFILPDCISK